MNKDLQHIKEDSLHARRLSVSNFDVAENRSNVESKLQNPTTNAVPNHGSLNKTISGN